MQNPFDDEHDVVCCCKTHLVKAMKAKKDAEESGEATNIPWDKDGKDGPDDLQNLMAILLEWVTTLGNYSKLKGDNTNRATKVRILGELTRQINAKGVRKERTTKQVINKLHHLTKT